MSFDGIRAVDKQPLAAFDYLFGMSTANGQRMGPRPVSVQDVAVQVGSAMPLGVVKSYASVAAMNADTSPAEGTLAFAEGKTYRKTAASGSAGWAVFLDFIPGAQLINATVTGGSANSILATSVSPISDVAYKQQITVGPFSATNTSAMTISINGETPRALVTNTGDPVPPSYIRSKMAVQVIVDADGKYRLFSFGDAAAIQAAAEAARSASEAARDVTLSAVPNFFPPTRAMLKGANTSTITSAYLKEPGREGQFVWKTGDFSTKIAADTAEGVYIKANAVAASVGAWVRSEFDGRTFNIMWFGAITDSAVTADMSVNLAAINIIHALAANNGATIRLPIGLIYINGTITITKPISWQGLTKFGSGLYSVGFNNDQAILNYAGTTSARIQNIFMRDMGFWSNNNLARAATLTWVNKSSFRDLYFYGLRRGFYGDNAWSNNYENISVFGLTDETIYFFDECNNSHFSRVEFRGSTGMRVVGHCAGLSFAACDFEGITSAAGYGLILAPTAGKFISGVSLIGCYFENIKGAAISCAGADARSVRGLVIKGCSIYGGSADYFSSAAGQATYGIILTNVSGFDISANTFDDWSIAAFFDNDTALDGAVENNTLRRVPALSSASDEFGSSVAVRNNYDVAVGIYRGRRERWVAAAPTSGTYRAGDMLWNKAAFSQDANGMVLIGWARATTGTNNVIGTDWLRIYASHNSPAV